MRARTHTHSYTYVYFCRLVMSTLHPLKAEQDLHGNGLEGGFLVFGTVLPNTKAYSYKVCHYD